MEHAQNTLNQLLAGREDVRQKVEVRASRLLPRSPAPSSPMAWASHGTVSGGAFLGDFSPCALVAGRQMQVTVPVRAPCVPPRQTPGARSSAARGDE